MADAPEELMKARDTGADFLLMDLDLALTFMEVADASGSEQNRKRNHENAHKAYRTVLRLLDSVKPEAPQWGAISQKLALLRQRLEEVGYRF